MKRSYLFSGAAAFGLAILFAGSFVLTGCKAPTTDYQQQDFATLRIMNFAPSGPDCTPTAPMDVYWDTKSPVASGNNAQVYDLKYGVASVYTNSLVVSSSGTDYYVTATPTRIPSVKNLNDADIKLSPGRYTVMITLDPANSGAFLHQLIPDGAQNPAPTSTYVRFINMQADAGALSVRVNDPVTGQLINSTPLNFNQVGSYMALTVSQDTSYAFFVVNSNNQVLARLSYQTFVGGQSYTLVYAGDPCQTVLNNPADSTASAVDTLRLRAFNDNANGNDQTNPILYSYRYNIVNDIDPTFAYDPNNAADNVLGFINGESYPKYSGFSITTIPPFQPGGAYSNLVIQPNGDTTFNVYYQSAALTDPLDIRAFSTSPSGENRQQVWGGGKSDLLADPATKIPPDMPVTFLFTGVDSSLASNPTDWNVLEHIIPIPDQSYPDSVTFVFYNGNNTSPGVAGTNLKTYFYVTNPNNQVLQPRLNGLLLNRSAPVTLTVWDPTGGMYTVADTVGTGATRSQWNSTTFNVVPGGIYEVFSLSNKLDPHLMIARVNAGNQQ